MLTPRQEKVLSFLLDSLEATTSYNEPLTQRTAGHKGRVRWRPWYGWDLELVPDNTILDADGKPTQFKAQRRWTNKPGDIIYSHAKRATFAPVKRYMIRPDHSLRSL